MSDATTHDLTREQIVTEVIVLIFLFFSFYKIKKIVFKLMLQVSIN